jgi:hypothetical protein
MPIENCGGSVGKERNRGGLALGAHAEERGGGFPGWCQEASAGGGGPTAMRRRWVWSEYVGEGVRYGERVCGETQGEKEVGWAQKKRLLLFLKYGFSN